ncbi:5-formyltetrahydrofolate cyclo-ligase [Kaistia sp. 32K]|uniref:5-formyltetrahydrofolate cyclo-ligase n=1 Tax=Kaistia sp. 32K TaxID=2795690 RepID=UPI0019159E61|nr:5-formyltetrahydrofolate cyclo-ligase [Kaistia sp. 32K]
MTTETDTTTKNQLRAAALARRDGLSIAARQHAVDGFLRHGVEWFEPAGRIVSGYWPIRSEADPRPLIEGARAAGATIALPVLVDAETLRFRRWEAGAELHPAGFGTVGPSADAPFVMPDVILLPLAAFDRRGHRIGYGKGHYDRAVAAIFASGARPLLVGLAFAVQEVDKVPFETHDIPLDYILTEAERITALKSG